MFFESLKANFIILVFFAAVVGIGYWAVRSLDVNPEELATEDVEVRPIVVNEPTGYDPNAPVTQVPTTPETPTPSPEVPSTSTPVISGGVHDDLIKDLEELVADNVLMKKGSRGTRVGTIQEFLNIYNGTDSKIDNDYGATTENQIKAFQKAEKLSADGQAGPGTYKKMIEWLKAHN